MKRRTRLVVLPVVVMVAVGAGGCCRSDSQCGRGRDNSGGDVFMPSPAANIRYVATTGRDNGTCTVQTSPCLTIQYALTQSVNTDIIEIDRGSYTGNVKIDHNDITIRGAGSNLTAVVGTIEAGNVDLSLKGFATGPNGVQSVGITLLDPRSVDIADVIVRGFDRSGISITSPDKVVIDEGQIAGTRSGDGLRLEQLGNGDVLIMRTIVSGNSEDGIQLNRGGSGGIVTIQNSLVENNGASGIKLEGTGGGSVTISSTCIRKHANANWAGIFLERPASLNMTTQDNNILSNFRGAAVNQPATGARFEMKFNFWGDANGPSIATAGLGNPVTGPIDVVPFLGSAAPTRYPCPP